MNNRFYEHNTHVQNEAIKLLLEMWENKETLWPGKQVTKFDILDPAIACHVLGYEYIEMPNLNAHPFLYKGKQFNTAGIIDRQTQRIIVATNNKPETIRFTTGHEVGHCILHPNEIVHHRDRPVTDAARSESIRSYIDKQADYFSSCFLIPPNLLKHVFNKLFHVKDQFIFDDTAAFQLNMSDPNSLLRADKNSLERELALASCTHFGQPINSLASIFKVSNSAMAIRIKELELVRWP